MKFIEVGRYKLFEKQYINKFIQQECGGKAALISKRIIKRFVRAFFKTNWVEILYYGFPHVIDCRKGGLQLDIYQLYGEGAPNKPIDTLNPFAVASFWNVGEIAYVELLENGKIKVTPINKPYYYETKKEDRNEQ